MPKAYVDYTATGSTNQFDLTFPYIAVSHVVVTFDGVVQPYTWVNASRIQTTVTPAIGVVVRVERVTPTEALTVYNPASTLRGADLNRALQQSLYCVEEADAGSAAAEQALALARALAAALDTGITNPLLFDTAAVLRSWPSASLTDGQKAWLFGYYARGDMYPVAYQWDAAATTATDSGSVHRPTDIVSDASPGRWKIVGVVEADPRTWGAHADGATDDWQAFVNMLVYANARSLPIRLYGRTYKWAAPADTFNNIRVMTWATGKPILGDGATILTGHQGTQIDSGNSINITAAYTVFENVKFNGQYTSNPAGAPQFNCNMVTISASYAGCKNCDFQNTKGRFILAEASIACPVIIGITGNGAGNYDWLQVSPADPQIGRPHAIQISGGVYGKFDVSFNIKRASQDAFQVFQTTRDDLEIHVVDSYAEDCGYYAITLEECKGKFFVDNLTVVNTGVAGDYSHTLGGVLIGAVEYWNVNNLKLRGSVTNSLSVIDYTPSAMRTKVGRATNCNFGLMYFNEILNAGADISIENCTWTDAVFAMSCPVRTNSNPASVNLNIINSRATGTTAAAYDTEFQHFDAGYTHFKAWGTDFKRIRMMNNVGDRTVWIHEFHDCKWASVRGENNLGAANGLWQIWESFQPIIDKVHSYNAAKTTFPIDHAALVGGGPTFPWNGTEFAGELQVINKGNIALQSLALEPGNVYWIRALVKYKDYANTRIGPTGLGTSTQFTAPSSTEYRWIEGMVTGFEPLTGASTLRLGVPTTETVTGTISWYVKNLQCFKCITGNASGSPSWSGGLDLSEINTYGTRLAAIKTNDT